MKLSALLLMPLAALAQERVTATFSDPSRPGTVRVEQTEGSITITGTAGKDVIIDAKTGESRRQNRERDVPTGMRRIVGGGSSFEVRENNNVMRIEAEGGHGGQNIVIQVPQRTSIVAKTVNGGTVRIENVEGEVEASNVNGSIVIAGVAGAVVADTVNGKIEAVLTRVTPDKPMSFTSMNGAIDVTFPPDLKANLRLRTDNGEIFTDFEVTVRNDPAKVTTQGNRRWKSESSTIAVVGGGGPEIRIQSSNGRIYIRKAK